MRLMNRWATVQPGGMFVSRSGLVGCPMGAPARDVCMQDPYRLAHWPEICRSCRERVRAPGSNVSAAEPD